MSDVHVVRQAFDEALHWKPLQPCAPNIMQVLAPPMQMGCGVNEPLVQNGKPQGVFAGWNPFVGQAAELPVQSSGTSHAPADARQVVLADDNTSEGHMVDEPEHVSCGSHGPALGRHTVEPPASTSLGQMGPVPVHCSAGSH